MDQDLTKFNLNNVKYIETGTIVGGSVSL